MATSYAQVHAADRFQSSQGTRISSSSYTYASSSSTPRTSSFSPPNVSHGRMFSPTSSQSKYISLRLARIWAALTLRIKWLMENIWTRQNRTVFLTNLYAWFSYQVWAFTRKPGKLVGYFVGLMLLAVAVLSLAWVSGGADVQDIPEGQHAAEPVTPDQLDNAVLTLNIHNIAPLPPEPIDPTHTLDEVLNQAGSNKVPWDAFRRYAVVIDAGSSGSRAQVYSWRDPTYIRAIAESGKIEDRRWKDMLPSIQKGTHDTAPWQKKQEPGISTFSTSPDGAADHIRPLLDFAASVIPTKKHASTPLYLFATAGMRLLKPEQQAAILDVVCTISKSYSFSVAGGCAQHFRVISGELEGIYGWISVNYLMRGFETTKSPNKGRKHTFGFLDMGGASTQIAFEPAPDMASEHSDDLTAVKLRTMSGAEHIYRVFVTTFLGYGTNEARRRYVEALIADAEASKGSNGNDVDRAGEKLKRRATPTSAVGDPLELYDPCLQSGLTIYDTWHPPPNIPQPPLLHGTGNVTACMDKQVRLLNKSKACPSQPCLFNGVHAPLSIFPGMRFLGVSEYWYSSEDVYDLGGAYDFRAFFSASEKFCGESWEALRERFLKGEWPTMVGGATDPAESSRFVMQCFKSSWIMTVLHEGFGIPRSGKISNASKTGSELDASPDASHSIFESVNDIGDFAISWTLGAVLLYASAGIGQREVIYPTASSLPAQATPWTLWSSLSYALLAVLLTGAAILFVRSRFEKARSTKYSVLPTMSSTTAPTLHMSQPDTPFWKNIIPKSRSRVIEVGSMAEDSAVAMVVTGRPSTPVGGAAAAALAAQERMTRSRMTSAAVDDEAGYGRRLSR
ncbi:nucleoside phosphatase family-domain-containing protein [Cladochytrium replicatum]|nr:nucleoside phosphatase family-domain-containing protein [Cladochytrium replicatum]